jgi:hypothetical protein
MRTGVRRLRIAPEVAKVRLAPAAARNAQMPDAILYCDVCMKMILRSDLRNGDGVATRYGAVCVLCLRKLTPEERGAYERQSLPPPEESSIGKIPAVSAPGGGGRRGTPPPSAHFRALRPPTGVSPIVRDRRKVADQLRVPAARGSGNAMLIAFVVFVAVVAAIVAVTMPSTWPLKQAPRPGQPERNGTLPTRITPAAQDAARGDPTPLGGQERLADASQPVTDGSGAEGAKLPSIVDGLVAYFRLDDARDEWATDSAGRRDARVSGSPTWELYGGAIDGAPLLDGTDGSDDYIELPRAGELDALQAGDYTVAAWVKPLSDPPGTDADDDASYAVVVKGPPHTGLAYGRGGFYHARHELQAEGAVASSREAYAPGEYHHVAAVVSKALGRVTLFVDGAEQGGAGFLAEAPSRSYGEASWRIGIAEPAAAARRWAMHGFVDDVRLYSRALGADEVRQLFALRTR